MDRAVLHDLVAGPDGLIGVGCLTNRAGDCVEGLLVTSPDGTSWTPVALQGAADARIRKVRRVGERVFAVGFVIDDERREVRAAAWTAGAEGAWSRIRSASFRNRALADVIESSVGAIAIGGNARYASEGGGFVVWDVATDGSFGEPIDVPINRPGSVQGVVGVAWLQERFLAWGPCGYCKNSDGLRSTMLMTSSDGHSWTVLPDIAEFQDGWVTQILAVGERLLAVGYHGSGSSTSPRAWTSGDGVTWELAQVPREGASMHSVGVEQGRLVARGEATSGDAPAPASWSSTDGTAWTRLSDGEDMPALAGFRDARRATLGERVCVSGTFYGRGEPYPRSVIYCR